MSPRLSSNAEPRTCSNLADKACVHLSSDDRRRESRLQLDEAVDIVLMGPPGGPPIPCTVLDISGSGVSVRSPRPVPAGVLLQIEGANRAMVGEAVRCDPQGDVYKVGISVRNVLPQKRD